MADPVSPSVRVRFAPSPTGYLHIGGLRTALYNYLFSRRLGGVFVLRIEDTDRSRFVEDAEEDILDSLEWAGIPFDEGPGRPGQFGPYRQSERRDLYARHAEELLSAGRAYIAFDTPAEIDAMRTRLATPENPSPRYDSVSRAQMRNSLSLSAAETGALVAADTPYVVRMRVDPGGKVDLNDLVRGHVTFATSEIDDQILVKSDGMPTYHLANVVDDHHMQISHVIRGEEWLPSTPKHALLYQAFGWEMPQIAHLPLILSPTGGKLSKRSADRQGIRISARDYRGSGYEAAALINYLAFLGWNPGDEREVFSLDEMVDAFSIDRVGSAGVQFDADKLAWYNQQHLRSLSPDVIAARAAPAFEAAGLAPDSDYVSGVAGLLQDRLTFPSDLAGVWSFFFRDPEEYDQAGVKKRWKGDSADLARAYAALLEKDTEFTPESLEAALRDLAAQLEAGAGRIIHPVRLAVSGVTAGPSLFDMLVVLGRETCVRRLQTAAERLG